MVKNLLVAQSGGPTAAINATLAGVLAAGEKSERVGTVFGAFHGIQGVLEEDFVDLSEIATEENIMLLKKTPAAALGSCRFKLKDLEEDESQYQQIIEILRKHEIGYFVYIGGNDSMDTVAKLSLYCKEKKIEDIMVVGGPKTIDNDLWGIDHCPGFGSAAKYISTSFAELEREAEVYDTPNVIIVEMMGRHAGWLTAAAALAQRTSRRVPYLIYLEEHVFSMESFLEDVKKALKTSNAVMVAVSEGVHNAKGEFICEADAPKKLDAFGHKMLSGTGKLLEENVKAQIGCKVRSIELNLLQRCAAHIMSKTDIEESFSLGANAVKLAVEGHGGMMSSLKREACPEYKVIYEGFPVSEVANKEKKVPQDWINEEGNGVTQEMIDYLLPLVQGEESCRYKDGLPEYLILDIKCKS